MLVFCFDFMSQKQPDYNINELMVSSNNLSRKAAIISFINHLCLLLGLAALLSWLYFGQRVGSWRRALHTNPLVDLGILSLAVWLFKQMMCWFYPSRKTKITNLISLAMLQILIVIILAMGYAMVVTHKGDGRAVSGRVYKEYDYWDFSKELIRYTGGFLLQYPMIEAVVDLGVCPRFGEQFNHLSELDFYNTNLTPLQSGCCKPPSYCSHQFKNATIWKTNHNPKYVRELDCKSWHEVIYCWYCYSCLGAILFNLKTEWRHMVFTNILLLLSLLSFYSLRRFYYSYSHKFPFVIPSKISV
ncbi:tetraspanin-11-like [Mercurialis annua]|uniref:tetraspanin-11-like n=1 Tax=Mercurialis annua TaxID=3986 RepID=UPI00215FAF0A|nr:tetraspanin-11-like [Mercurialis annua]